MYVLARLHLAVIWVCVCYALKNVGKYTALVQMYFPADSCMYPVWGIWMLLCITDTHTHTHTLVLSCPTCLWEVVITNFHPMTSSVGGAPLLKCPRCLLCILLSLYMDNYTFTLQMINFSCMVVDLYAHSTVAHIMIYLCICSSVVYVRTLW